MLFHQLPIELFSRIAKEAVNMEVEEYGPSEHEFLWGLQDANPNYRWPPRVREYLDTACEAANADMTSSIIARRESCTSIAVHGLRPPGRLAMALRARWLANLLLSGSCQSGEFPILKFLRKNP